MVTLKLRVDETVYEKLLVFLKGFGKYKVEILSDDTEFMNYQKYLKGELEEILSGDTRFVDINVAEERIEKIISKCENNI